MRVVNVCKYRDFLKHIHKYINIQVVLGARVNTLLSQLKRNEFNSTKKQRQFSYSNI